MLPYLITGAVVGILHVVILKWVVYIPGSEKHKVLIHSLLSLIVVMITGIIITSVKVPDNLMWLGFGYGLALFTTPIYFAIPTGSR